MEAHMNARAMGMCPIPPSWSAATPRLPLHHLLLLLALASDMEDAHHHHWTMVERRGTHLWASGRPFIIHGFNTYWLMSFAADQAMRPRVTAAIAEAAEAGLNVCRTWAFSDGGYRALQTAPFHYDEDVFRVSYHGASFACARAARQVFVEMRGRDALVVPVRSSDNSMSCP
jgi:mannan endo-1,4-beta-mannosidase